MKLVLKIIPWIVGILFALVVAIFIWAYFKVAIPDFEISEHDTATQKVEKADAWLHLLQQENYFNGAVLLIKNDSTLLKKAYGFADHKKTKQLNNASMFRLASVSKQFTAVGIMLLKEHGKLNFDDKITIYLPELPYSNVTIRHLLNHTSGIPDVYMDFPGKHKDIVGDLLTNTKVVQLLAKENLPLISEPNSNYQYSNTGYVLLSAIIERISDISFEAFMKSEVFDKLGMTNTRVWNLLSEDFMFTNKTESFKNVFGNAELLEPSVLDGVSGDGSVFSSIDDFEKWNQFWYANTLLSKESFQDAFSKPKLNNGAESNYGFGWSILNKVAHAHSGSWLGARTLIIRNTQLKNCIVILDNSQSLNTETIAQELVDVLR